MRRLSDGNSKKIYNVVITLYTTGALLQTLGIQRLLRGI
jgi:hypothetical protein